MSRFIAAYFAALVTLAILDFLWLGFIAKGFIQAQVGPLLLERPNWTAAVLFYLLYIVGVLIFAVAPGLEAGAWSRALLLGALFGFFAYATYDFTNLATLKGWTTALLVVDVAWGAFVTAAAALAGYGAARLLPAS
jgi:uncharacterized membrane protein